MADVIPGGSVRALDVMRYLFQDMAAMSLVYVSSMVFNTMQHPYTTTIAQNLVLLRRTYAGHTEHNNG